jgi:prepilin-type N-terminal cleavage/methylation domain-containing protein
MDRQFRLKNSGMTLLETLMVISIFTVMSLAITTGITEFYKLNAYTIEQSDEVENARRGILRWAHDVRELTGGEDGSYPIAVMQDHRFGYFSDTDLDNSVEYIEYILATTTLRKYIYNATGTPISYNYSSPDKIETLSLYVQNINQGTSTFMYFDNNGNRLGTTTPAVLDVRYIQAQLIVNIDQNRFPGEFMLRSSIAPRNLKDNL